MVSRTPLSFLKHTPVKKTNISRQLFNSNNCSISKPTVSFYSTTSATPSPMLLSSLFFPKRLAAFPIFGSLYATGMFSGLSFFGIGGGGGSVGSAASVSVDTSSLSAGSDESATASGASSPKSPGSNGSVDVSGTADLSPPLTPVCAVVSPLVDFFLPVCHMDSAVPSTKSHGPSDDEISSSLTRSNSEEDLQEARDENDKNSVYSMETDETLVHNNNGDKASPPVYDFKSGIGCWGKSSGYNNNSNSINPNHKNKKKNSSNAENNNVEKRSSICEDNCGEDAYFLMNAIKHACYGVADGVGGWSLSGVDPAIFSRKLMHHAKEISASLDTIAHPKDIMDSAFQKVCETPDENPGGSTACFVSIDKHSGRMAAANLGDSGFLIVRDGQIIYRSKEQQHFFNAPYQLSLYPSWIKPSATAIINVPADSNVTEHQLVHGDVIILGSDGLFDNVYDKKIVSEIGIFEKSLYTSFPEYKSRMQEFHGRLAQEREAELYGEELCRTFRIQPIASQQNLVNSIETGIGSLAR